jgi:hypothetical protein
MELLDRYLHSVKRYLPEAQQDDIAQELEENIRAQMEDRETELGRRLTEAETEALLKQHGAPIVVAARYRPAGHGLAFGRQLIGPILFPYYVKVLALNMGIAAAIVAAIAIAMAMPPQQAFYTVLWPVFWQFVVVTAIFCAVEIHVAKSPEHWLAISPVSGKARLQVRPAISPAPRNSRLEALCELISLAVFFSLLRAVGNNLPAKIVSHFPPVWHQLYVAVLALTAAGMVQAAICLIFPAWTRFRAWARVACGVAWLAVWGYVLAAANVNRIFFWNLIVALIVSLAIVLLDVRRLVRAYRGTPQILFRERIQL